MTASDNRPALNILRGLASVVVVFYHFRYFSDFPWFEEAPWVRFGFMGVDFFFILSGLIISHVYLKPMEHYRESYAHFLYLRIARIFPVHFLLMAAMLAVSVFGNTDLGTMADWFSLTFLFRQFLMPDGYAWNTPAWSVSAEMFAYAVVFPIIVYVVRGRERAFVGLFLVVIGIVVMMMLYTFMGTLNVTNGAGPLLRVTGCFLIGAGLHCLLAQQNCAKVWDYAILLGLLLLVWLAEYGSQFAILACLCLVIVGAYMSSGPVSRKMSGRYGYVFGEISFSLYMCHVPLLMLFSEIAIQMNIYRGLAFCAVSLAGSIAGAWLLYTYVEVPARTALRKRWAVNVKTGGQPMQLSSGFQPK